MQANKLAMLIRGHQYRHCMKTGFISDFTGRMLTVFSSSNYCGTESNTTGYALVTGPNCMVEAHVLRTKEESSAYKGFNIFKIAIDERTKEVTHVVF